MAWLNCREIYISIKDGPVVGVRLSLESGRGVKMGRKKWGTVVGLAGWGDGSGCVEGREGMTLG